VKLLLSLSTLCLLACTTPKPKKMTVKNHSFSNYEEVKLKHLSLHLKVDFSKKELWGSATLQIENTAGASHIILDHKTLKVDHVAVTDVNGKIKEVSFEIGPEDTVLGAALIIPIEKDTREVSVAYHTTPESESLQWLSPEQTHDKKNPFLFSQSQAILARTWIPLQDCPAVRFTYDASIEVPSHLMAMMSAENPTSKNVEGKYTFKQTKPIPSYLMALAVGDVEFTSLGRNSGVYAEPGMLKKSVWELADMQSMIDSAEALYGPYAWGRYDVLVLPPSFPFGGMENPVLTFATPTIIAGDRSLVSLVAHELAHSWSGNLVTNETWSDFWLNEGFTVYFEQRIMEKIYGRDYAEMLAEIGRGELQHTLDDFMQTTPDETKLFLNLDGRNPDDGVTDIAYEKGRFFLRRIEEVVGRPAWDAFLNDYFKTHAFQTMNTTRFIAYLNEKLLNKHPGQIDLNAWIYGTGLPKDAPVVKSKELQRVETDIVTYTKSRNPADIHTKDYSTHHWLHLLRGLPALSVQEMAALDKAFKFTGIGNAEIACDWYTLSVKNGYETAYPDMAVFLKSVGRRKFLLPIYKNLVKTAKGKALAEQIFSEARKGYHAVASGSIEEIIANANPK
jgi:aminopeptidase N